MESDAVIRPVRVADSDGAADVYLRSRHSAVPAIPRLIHDDHEVHVWFHDVLLRDSEVWVATDPANVVLGVMALTPGWLDQLYIDPPASGRGVGRRLLQTAKQRNPSGLRLWTFETNVWARRFYERHGFVEEERTDGSGNEERAPDIRLLWSPG